MFCTKCGKEIPENVNFCPSCGQAIQVTAESPVATAESPVATAESPVATTDGWSALIPRNKYALISYYVGLCSIFFGIVLGPIAIITGIKGLNYADKNSAAKGKVHAGVGIGCGSISLLFWSLIIILIIIIASEANSR